MKHRQYQAKSHLRYPGGKSKALKKIIPIITEVNSFEEYREPMIGGGSIFFAVKQVFPDKRYWINDINKDLCLFYRNYKENYSKLINEIRKINFELTKQMRILAEIARKRNIPVLITNQIYHWENERKMVAGDILDYWSKCLIELLNEGGRRTAHLRKHRSLPDKKFAFQIVNEGVRKKGWI